MKHCLVTCLASILMVFHMNESSVFAQKQDYNWMMSYHGSSLNPPRPRNMVNFEGGHVNLVEYTLRPTISHTKAILSDREGRYRFLSDGINIYDRNFDVVEGSDILIPGPNHSRVQNVGYRVNQGAMLLPIGEAERFIVLLHQDPVDHDWCEQQDCSMQLYFTLLDGHANSGLGKVLLKSVRIAEDTLWSGMITAMRHENESDWWVIVWNQDSNAYLSVLVTSSGAVVSHKEYIGEVMHWKSNGSTQAVFSPDGTKYAHFSARSGLFLYDFDRSNGRLSRFRSWQPEQFRHSLGGCAFAPGSRYLYVNDNIRMYQIDTWADDLDSGAHRLADYDWKTGVLYDWFPKSYYQSLLGADCKIYIGTGFVDSVFHVIHKPDEGGDACEFEQFAFVVPERMSYTPPNLPHFRIGEEAISHCEQVTTARQVRLIRSEGLSVWPNPASKVLGIGFPEGLDGEATISIYGLTGNLVLQAKGVVVTGGVSTIVLTDVKPGLYILEAQVKGGQKQTSKLIIR